MLKDAGPFRRAALKSYVSRMSQGDSRALYDNHVAEVLEQQGFVIEDAPRSIYEPEQLYTALTRYADQWDEYEFLDSHLEFGFRMAFKIFAKPSDMKPFEVLSDQEVVSKALKLTKNAGLPSLSSKKEDLPYAFHREQQVRKGLKAPNPCVAFKRTQANNKTRLVWGYPLEMTIIESRFARPLIDYFKSSRTTMAFGLAKGTLGMYIDRYINDVPGRTVALDYSKFDSTISKTMIKQSFRILSTWFTSEDLTEYAWNSIVGYFISTPIVMPDGHLYKGKNHGVPSGSYFTQIIDSIVNTAVCFALSSRFGFNLNWKSLFVLGDDVLMRVKGEVNLDQWSEYVNSFGLRINVEKTMLDEPHFLGAYWFTGKPTAPVQELVNKAAQPESFRNYQGQPDRGAEMVLESYARGYLSAYRFLRSSYARLWHQADDSNPITNSTWLSGSDRFLLEEGRLGKPSSSFNEKRFSLISTGLFL